MASSSSAASVSSSSSKGRRKSKDKGSTSKSASSSSKRSSKDIRQDDTASGKHMRQKSQRSAKSQSQIPPSPPDSSTDSKTQPSSITIDLLLRVANYTILHPWAAWMVPLSFRAQAMPYSHSAMRYSISWAAFLTLLWVLKTIDARIAFGPPREINIAPLKGKNKRKKKRGGKGRKLKGEVDDDDDIDGETVDGEDEELMVVTGGGSGLGKALAEMYGMRRVGVATLDVKGDKEDEEKGVRWFPCDVGIREQVENAKVKIEDELGTPTILVNNAGLMLGKSILDLTPNEIERSIRVNFLAHYHTVKAFLPGMLAKGRGTIVTVSSVLATYGAANLSDYTACKAALHTFHASLAAEIAASNHPSASKIKTILVAPGQMATPMFARVQTPSTFLSPLVSPLDVAKEIARVIDAGDGGFVAEPAHARFAWLWYVLTPGLRTLVRRYSGIDEAIKRAK